MEFNFSAVEKYAREKWGKEDVYRVETGGDKPKYYVLDMFPYPSGAGLHVGHPLGYIASDIYARYKRLKGFNVLHPMGFDAFGLPAEQYAIQTGQHPAKTTAENIKRYKEQLGKIGFSFDWSREVSTADPSYYKWTQWIFLQLFGSWYDKSQDKARAIEELEDIFSKTGNGGLDATCDDSTPAFSAADWNGFSEKERSDILMHYRLAYVAFSTVNWCPALGTVLANDEVKDGVSERGGHPVEKKKMRQWFLRITAYAQRLLDSLDHLEWSDSMKEMQRNWIGRSTGASVVFKVKDHDHDIEVFTTRVDTLYGVTFLVLAPEHELVAELTTPEYKAEVEKYLRYVNSRSEVDRQADVKHVTGQFIGSYVLHPMTGEHVPIYIADYVLAGYGTGAVMAVPSGDQRDYLFAKKFSLPIVPILDTQVNLDTEADATKEGRYINSGIIEGMRYAEAVPTLIAALEKLGRGKGKIQFRMRDAGFSRQRYWGEPFPVYWKDDIAYPLSENDLPVELPEIHDFKPTGTGESPLAKAVDWVNELGDGKIRETDTMPAFAGSSWYFLRYMDPRNDSEFVSFKAQDYWKDVDLYIGGTEHAVGHLLYSRFWHKFFKDKGWVSTEEPFKKLVNQGMIGGKSVKLWLYGNVDGHGKTIGNSFNYRPGHVRKLPIEKLRQVFFTKEMKDFEYKNYSKSAVNIPISICKDYHTETPYLDQNSIKLLIQILPHFAQSIIVSKEGYYEDGIYCYEGNLPENEASKVYLDVEFEKMSKSKLNVVNPDEVIEEYGADCFRMFEMFLGPIEQHKPWDTKGISGVSNFLRKFWRLFNIDEQTGQPRFRDGEPKLNELKIVHKTIKKVTDDIERFSFNTAVSAFMICVNELGSEQKHNRELLEKLVILIAPFAPFMAEALWEKLGNTGSVVRDAQFPVHDPKYLVEESIQYPISINGKVRTKIDIAADLAAAAVEQIVMEDATVQKWLEGKAPKKVIVVPGRIVNVVV